MKRTMAQAFTEWLRRWQEEPDRFSTESEMLNAVAITYGETSAAYLNALMAGDL